jgi:hypothetical protein
MIMRMDMTASRSATWCLSKVTTLGAMGDLARNIIRPLVQKFVPGTVAIAVRPEHAVDRHQCRSSKLLDHNLTPQKVIDALATGTPSSRGNVYIRTRCRRLPAAPRWSIRSWAASRSGWSGTSTCATWRPSMTTSTSRMDTRRSTARSRLSADHQEGHGIDLTVVADVHKAMQMFRRRPQGRAVNFEFDESPTVVAAVDSVATRG